MGYKRTAITLKFQQLLGINPVRYQRLWVVVNAAGFAIAILFIFVLRLLTLPELGLPMVGLLMGSVVGVLQALVLKQHLSRLKVWYWMIATGLGNCVGLALWRSNSLWYAYTGNHPVFNTFSFIPPTLFWLLLLVVCGCFISLSVTVAQLLVLRKHARALRQWGWMNFIGYCLGCISVYGLWHVIGIKVSIESLGDLSWDMFWLLIGLATRGIFWGVIGGAIYGSITAYSLQQLRSQP